MKIDQISEHIDKKWTDWSNCEKSSLIKIIECNKVGRCWYNKHDQWENCSVVTKLQ